MYYQNGLWNFLGMFNVHQKFAYKFQDSVLMNLKVPTDERTATCSLANFNDDLNFLRTKIISNNQQLRINTDSCSSFNSIITDFCSSFNSIITDSCTSQIMQLKIISNQYDCSAVSGRKPRMISLL